MYSYNEIDFGFLILCPERAINLLKTTTNSIKSNYPEVSFICATDLSANEDDLAQMNQICPTLRGKGTISSLINVGLENVVAEWNFIVFAGVNLRPNMGKRFSLFIENEKDILFPIVERKINFVDATLNGLFLHKNAIKEIGKMADLGTIEVVKLMWALSAIDKGYKFKAIANSKIC